MKKRIILLLILLSLTGCKVEYKINLDENLNIEESINFISTSSIEEKEIKEKKWNIPIKYSNKFDFVSEKEKGVDYYKFKNILNGINYNYKYSNDRYQKYIDSTFVNLAYRYLSITKVNDNELVISTSKEFLIFDRFEDVEEIKITFSTNYKVLSNNADEVKKHDYTWILTKDNDYDKNIYLKIDPSTEDLNFFEKLIRGDYFNPFTISLLILGIGVSIYIYLKNKSNNRDKI